MIGDTRYWIEQGMIALASALASEPGGYGGLHRVASAVPPVRGLARLWGAIEPSRAAGFASAVSHPFLRAYLRAAAMEFASWPATMAAGVLRRAEHDLLDAPGLVDLATTDAADLCDAIAVGWARRHPAELPAVDQRLRETLLHTAPSPLWRQEMIDQAAALTLMPDQRELPPGDLESWFRKAVSALTGAQRARACLALAAASYETNDPS